MASIDIGISMVSSEMESCFATEFDGNRATDRLRAAA